MGLSGDLSILSACEAESFASFLFVKNVSVRKLVFEKATQQVWRPLESCAAPGRFWKRFGFAPHFHHAIRVRVAVSGVGPERLPLGAGIASGKLERRSYLIKPTAAIHALMDSFAIANQR